MLIPTFLKWAGGKRRLISKLEPLFPKKIDRYFEPFLGGGYMFFYIKRKYNPEFCMISDINKDLIETYKAVRDNPKRLIHNLKFFNKNHSKEFYYIIREKFNCNKLRYLRRCAAFIYLNKTCFNGLYRVNSKNEFNVPFGRYNNLEIYNEQNILFASQLLQGVRIEHQDYREITKSVKKDDFIYLDPCYDPIKKTSFVNYTPKGFSEIDRIELAKFIRILINKGAKIILSNNDLSEIRESYSDLKIYEIFVSRSINSNPLDRGKIIELAISNC